MPDLLLLCCCNSLTVFYFLVKALGNACFELDPDKRPTFKECVEQLTAMLAAVSAPATAKDDGLTERNQTRPAIHGSEIPDVLTCSNQAPVQTEVELADVPAANVSSIEQGAAVAPNKFDVAPISTAVAA